METIKYRPAKISVTVFKNDNQNGAPRSKTFLLNENGCIKYYIQMKCWVDSQGVETMEPVMRTMNTCCTSGIIIDGEETSHELNVDKCTKPKTKNAKCPYTTITFCRVCLDPVEDECIIRCFNGQCGNKPGVVKCYPYVFSDRNKEDSLAPLAIYSSPLSLCNKCAKKQ